MGLPWRALGNDDRAPPDRSGHGGDVLLRLRSERTCSRDVAYCIADKDGNLVSEQWFEVPYCALMHDFAITETYAIFPVFPTTADLDRLKAGGDHWMHDPELDSWIA